MPDQERKRIYSYLTRSRFLHVEDELRIGKIRLFVGQYQRGQGAKATAYHFLDLDDARVILTELCWGKLKGKGYQEFKGTAHSDNGPISRVLEINRNEDKYWLQIDNGPGEVVGQGAVKPAGSPEASVSVPLPIWEARKLAHATLAYIRAWEARHLLETAETAPRPLSYSDGSLVGDKAVEREAFRAYAEAHNGEIPPSKQALREWYGGHNG
jgi:hypothetical protein